MSATQEKIRKRKEYLRKRTAAYVWASLNAFLVLPCILIAFALFLYNMCYICFLFHTEDMGRIAFVFLLAILAEGMALLLAHSAHQARQEAGRLRYVPPVTAATLPLEEVLLRRSEEPAQEQRQTLLRSLDSDAETTGQELLRSSQAGEAITLEDRLRSW